MKKKMLALILAVLMAASMLPLSASAITGKEEINTATGWYWPLPANCKNITQGFGRKESSGKFHQGIDIAASKGTEIRAARPGVVYAVGSHSSMGNFVCIRHGKSGGKYIYTTYMHMTRTATTKGAEVDQNTVIGYVGSTGNSSGNHLHFHIFRANSANSSSYSPDRSSKSALNNNYIDPSPSNIQYGGGGSGSGPVGKTSTPSVSVNGQDVTVSWSYSGSGSSIAVYLIQEPWAWADIKYTQVVSASSTSCTFSGVAPGYYQAFTIAQPNEAYVQSEWTVFTVQEPHTTHSTGNLRYTATEHPHYNYYSCSVCGQEFTDGSTTPDNTCRQCHWEHVWDGGTITKPPQVGKDGKKVFQCTICGTTKTETVPQLPTNWGSLEGDGVTYVVGIPDEGFTVTVKADGTVRYDGQGSSSAPALISFYTKDLWPFIESNVTTVIIGEGVTGLVHALSMFGKLPNLSRIVLPDSLETLQIDFSDNPKLNELYIPKNLKNLWIAHGKTARKYLQAINVDPQNMTYTSVDGVVYSKDKIAFY